MAIKRFREKFESKPENNKQTDKPSLKLEQLPAIETNYSVSPQSKKSLRYKTNLTIPTSPTGVS